MLGLVKDVCFNSVFFTIQIILHKARKESCWIRTNMKKIAWNFRTSSAVKFLNNIEFKHNS